MTQDEPSPEDHWEQDREELRWLARLHLSPRLRGKVDPSDIVQQTLLKAYERRRQCRGQNGPERTAWLRRILANTLNDALRKYQREVRLEHGGVGDVEESSARLEAWLEADQSSPSQQAMREEQLLRLAAALAQLPTDQRTAVEYHHLKDESVSEIAQRMGRTEASVTGLLRRGLQKLRELLQDVS
jgi:RNA polymerase sigma-70 factor (ECF subfamily)